MRIATLMVSLAFIFFLGGVLLGPSRKRGHAHGRHADQVANLEDQRRTAEGVLEALRSRDEYLEELERDRDALLASRMNVAPGALDSLTPEERHQVYKVIKLKVVSPADGPLEVSGAFVPSQELGTSGLTRLR
jgi:hypothetical protein